MMARSYFGIIEFHSMISAIKILFSYIIIKMGAEQHKFTNQKPEVPRSDKVIPVQYQIFYQNWQADPNYFQTILTQNATLTHNILAFFPHARRSYEQFLQMVFYLRRYDPNIQVSEYAKYNVHNTTLLDRFFMLIMKIDKYQQLETIKIHRGQMEDLFLQLMKIFLPHPQKGFGYKLLKFIGMKEVQQSTVKQYSANLRQFLPHIQKHIKDYYQNKFKFMKKNGFLLQNFKSQIQVEDAVFLSMKLAELTSPNISLLYEPRNNGTSFYSIQKNIVGYTGPWLLLLQHIEKDNEGKNVAYHIGSYQSGPIRDVTSHQGDIRGFLFQTSPKIKHLSAQKGSGGNYYFLINNLDQKTTKSRKGIGFGGNKDKENFKLWIDQDLDKSTVFNGQDATYGFGSLVNPMTTHLNITKIEIWGLGNEQDLQNRAQYWESRDKQIQKRRKVNKEELLHGDASLMFENTFAHRDQVYGVIEKNKKEQQESSYQEKKSHNEERNQQQ